MRERENAASPAEGIPVVDSRPWTGAVRQTIGGRYKLLAPIGRGGMGEVWKAKHLVTGRNVALKLLNRNLSERLEMRHRFLREARAAATVAHPNVIEVLDAFEDEGLLALVMPLLEGEALSKFLRREGPLSVATVLDLFLPLVSAVDAAHAAGIVHRDLKPDNVFLVNEGGRRHVKVLDFGIAKLMNPAAVDGVSLTATGSPIGTLWYMAPEQCLGDSTQDHLVDVWALGVILYEMLAGRRPIEGQNLAQVMKASLLKPIKPLKTLVPDLPRDISKLAQQMLSIERAGRPQTLQEVYQRLVKHVPSAQRREWQRAQREDAQRSSSVPDPSSEPPALVDAATVRASPTDHAMLSSVRPPALSWSRHAWLIAVGFAATSLVFALVRRAPLPTDGTEPVAAAVASLAASAQPPKSLEHVKPPASANTAAPSAPSAKPPALSPAPAAPRAAALPKSAVAPAASLAPPVESKLPVRSTTDGPRPLDTNNPFFRKRP